MYITTASHNVSPETSLDVDQEIAERITELNTV